MTGFTQRVGDNRVDNGAHLKWSYDVVECDHLVASLIRAGCHTVVQEEMKVIGGF